MLLIKKLRLGLHLARGLLTALMLFPFLSEAGRHRRIRAWSQKLLRLCGMQLEVEQRGPLPESGVMLLCNHVSWIDIFAINAWQPVRFVAKAEIRHWPLVGWLCVQTRTIFLQRERRADARRIMHYLSECLRDGDIITVFPEGTTTDGRSLLPFHANLLQAPVSTGKPVQPLCLFYTDAASGRHTMAPAYIGEMTLIESIDMILRAPPMTVRLAVGEPQYPQDGQHRRDVALAAQKAVGDQLQGYLPEAVLPQSGSVGSREAAVGDEEGDTTQAVQV
ncbi:lysophospholipid acyltransferase family protein [Pandoraea sp. PE-S2T-3]|uniref:lysophospholipid acyltransferase family protein n=1 Tax=Pandoraea sp. PE-S2T-3 TaxID=1986993 RepID=UPI000B3F757A|nr:lysophospholipid acyltransferase family protein [Pandoraea sp. PE-S2T-3]